MKLVGAKYGSIFLPKNGVLERAYASSPALYQIKTRKKGKTYTVYKSKTPYILQLKGLQKIHPEFIDLGVESDIGIPLSYGNITIGVLSVLSPKNIIFTKDDLNILKIFGPLATLAIHKSHLHNELLEALEVRDLFISTAAHELKTPLTTIFAYTQLIAKDVDSKRIPKSNYIKTLSLEVIRLSKLINELLEVDRVKKDKLKFVLKKCDLLKITQRAIDDFFYIYPDYIISFKNNTGKENAFVRGDSDKLLQVVTNLLNNSVKFSPKGSKIEVLLKKTSQDCILQITDKGKGISKDDLPHIFNKFYKGLNSTKSGMGLGLYLVKHIIEKHKGKITAISEINQGTTITITLPIYRV